MREFNYDCLQRHQVCVVRMPSDGTDPSSLNGPCRVYRLGRPMEFSELISMPEDLQKLYLTRLRQRGGTEETAAAMLHTTRSRLRELLLHHRVLLNQADTPERLASARELGAALSCPGIIGAVQKGEIICSF